MKFEIFILSLVLNICQGKKYERKLQFTPYLSAFENYGAQKVDAPDNQEQEYIGATEVGSEVKNTSSIIPGGFSGNQYQPGTYGTPMAHLGNTNPHPFTSTNPNPFAPFNGGGMGSAASFGQSDNSGMIQNMGGQGGGARTSGSDRPLIEASPLSVPRIEVREKCDSIKKQAVEISNAILNEQYKRIFKFLTKYLESSKYLVGMSQVKLTKKMRTEMFDIMHAFSHLGMKQVQFSDSNVGELTTKEIEDAMKDINLDDANYETLEEENKNEPEIDEIIHKV